LKGLCKMKFKKRAEEIIILKKRDDTLREQLIAKGELGKGYNTEMEQLHNRNAHLLDKIIEEIGYPTAKKVGKEASEAAWLIIQHAISQPAFMKKCALLLKNEVDKGVGNPLNWAYLTDRIASFEGQLQRFGTQYDWDENGQLNPLPMEQRIVVNKRRKALGLLPIEKQTQLIRKNAKQEGQLPPDDFNQRKSEMEQWKIKVGWVI